MNERHDIAVEATGQKEWSINDSDDASPNPNTSTNDDIEQESETDNSEEQHTSRFDTETQDIQPEIVNNRQYPDFDSLIDLGVIQVNYTTRELGDGSERPTVHLFCRHPDTQKPIEVKVHNFAPYFYTSTEDANAIDTSKQKRIRNIENGYESIRGKKLSKVVTDVPKTVSYLRNDYSHYEADVLFPDRFMVDKGIDSGIRLPARWEDDSTIIVDEAEIEAIPVDIEPRVHTVDIEVEDRNGFPEPEDAEEKIISLTAHDSYRDEYVIWSLTPDGANLNDIPNSLDNYDFIEDEYDVSIKQFGEEAAMMDDYVNYIKNTDPDILTGWNFDDFDAPYIVNRLDYLGNTQDHSSLSGDDLSRIGETWSGGWHGPNIKGRVVLDLLEAYKRTQFSELESYRLDFIGESELDVGKEVFDGKVAQLWEDDTERMLEYNLRDVEICVELDRKQAIIDFWNEVRQFVGCRMQDAPIPGDAVDMYVLHKVNGKFVLPSKGEVETADEDYEGGAVFDPISGIREMVTVLDLKSLYPMCMMTTNASPETKVDPETYDGDTFKTPYGTHYRKDEDGIIREMVRELLNEREQKKDLRSDYEPGDDEYALYDRQQAAVKVIMNSLYGVLGWERFRLYDKDNAAAVTSVGREVIKFTEQVVNEMGSEVVYGDTDSVMLELQGIENKQTAIERSFEIEEHINERYDNFAKENLNAKEHYLQIEFEKLYRRFLQAGKKKRYAGHIIWKEGDDVDKTDITGFEYKRSDIAGVTKESQKKLINMLIYGEDHEDIREYLHEFLDKYENDEFTPEEMGIPSGIGKELDNYDTETAHVRGAKYANLVLGTQFGEGSKPKRLYLKKVHPRFFRQVEEELGLDVADDPLYAQFKRDPDVIDFIHNEQLPDEFDIDRQKMINKTLRAPLSRILEAVGISWEEIESGQKQTGIGNFM